MSQKLQPVLAVLARYDNGETTTLPFRSAFVTSLIGRTNEGQ